MTTKLSLFLNASMIASLFILSACSNSGDNDADSTQGSDLSIETSTSLIKINQLGFLPSATKYAIVPATSATSFEVINTADNSVALSGELSSIQTWLPANEKVRIADFSALDRSGRYTIKVPGIAPSIAVDINTEVFLKVHDAALKAYYFNRASTSLESEYATLWQREAGHPDDSILVHSSAADDNRPTSTMISAAKGWYDAGDYNKYIVNSGISTYTLLAAYDHFTSFYQTRVGDIPESDNAVPDILDEIKWNLDWMIAMQDPNDGGVYHKLTTLNFSGAVMPEDATNTRYVVQKGTSAALNFAAVMAFASRVYADFEQFNEVSDTYKHAAIKAWIWAQNNPQVAYKQAPDVKTGEYGDNNFDDERLWAAAELFLLTKDQDYLTHFDTLSALSTAQPNVPAWPEVATLGYMSLLNSAQGLLSVAQMDSVKLSFLGLADSIVKQHQASAYAVAMENEDFVWGSSAVALNKSMVLLNAYSLTNNLSYKQAATGLLDYVLGRNPTDYSFVTGYGVKTPIDPHHRQSYSDSVAEPVPGFVIGGPQPGQQDKCGYPSDLPALSYLDDWCSYSTNEVTINWNAPLVYSLAAMQVLQQ